MQVVAVASQKGGAGKSTIAVNLALAADREGAPALLIDTDPQASLTLWRDRRDGLPPVLIPCRPGELSDVLQTARGAGIAWAFIDGPPHSRDDIAALMRPADLVVIPTRPGAFDLAATVATVETARALMRPFLVVLNAVPPRRGGTEAAVTQEARRLIETLDAPLWRGAIAQRASYAQAAAAGKSVSELDPESPAAREIERLWRDVQRASAAIAQLRSGDPATPPDVPDAEPSLITWGNPLAGTSTPV